MCRCTGVDRLSVAGPVLVKDMLVVKQKQVLLPVVPPKPKPNQKQLYAMYQELLAQHKRAREKIIAETRTGVPTITRCTFVTY